MHLTFEFFMRSCVHEKINPSEQVLYQNYGSITPGVDVSHHTHVRRHSTNQSPHVGILQDSELVSLETGSILHLQNRESAVDSTYVGPGWFNIMF